MKLLESAIIKADREIDNDRVYNDDIIESVKKRYMHHNEDPNKSQPFCFKYHNHLFKWYRQLLPLVEGQSPFRYT